MVNRSSTRYDRSTTRSTMLSISDDSASARNPTWPRLTPSSGVSEAITHSAPRLIVPSGELSDRRGQIRAQAGQIFGRHSYLDASSAQALDQSYGAGDGRWSTRMGEYGNPANRMRMTVWRAHLPQHRAAEAVGPGTPASRSAGSDRHHKWRSGE